jgi:DNA-binding CsgD family transcriptional regulator
MTGNPLSNREFEIVKLIGEGLNSTQIADKLFLSVNTVNTHRRNILEKTGKASISELIYDFQARRIL